MSRISMVDAEGNFLTYEALRANAKAGDAESQYQLAELYGIQIPETASHWYKQAAQQKHIPASFKFSIHLFTSLFGAHLSYTSDKLRFHAKNKNFINAVALIKFAAKADHTKAQRHYADLLYALFHATRKYENDKRKFFHEQALSWYKKLADNHDSTAAYKTAELMLFPFFGHHLKNIRLIPKNHCLIKNFNTALHYLKQAADGGIIEAQAHLRTILLAQNDKDTLYQAAHSLLYQLFGSDLNQTPDLKTNEKLIADYQCCTDYLIKNSEQKDPRSFFLIGLIYHLGLGCPKDTKKAKNFYGSAAELGSKAAHYNLGKILEKEGHSKEALDHFQQASDQNYFLAHLAIGFIHFYGRGVTVNTELAEKYFDKARALKPDETEAYLQREKKRVDSLPAEPVVEETLPSSTPDTEHTSKATQILLSCPWLSCFASVISPLQAPLLTPPPNPLVLKKNL